MYQKPRAIVYTRVSSEAQVDNTSLDEQLRLGKEYCSKKGLELVQEFRELGESAKFTERTQLKEALQYCSVKKNNIRYFLVYKFDRFSRSVENHHFIKAILSRSDVKLISMSEDTPDTPAGRLTENMLASFAQFDNEIRTERCVNGIRSKLLQGVWLYEPPLGYIKDESFKGKSAKPIIPDPEKFEIIQKGWEMILTGNYKQIDVIDYFNKVGLKTKTGKPIRKQLVSKIFSNLFYAGIIYVDNLDVKVEGNHQAMISEDQFHKVQLLLEKNRNTKKVKHLGYNPDFPLNKIIHCSYCNKVITGAWSKQKGRFGYYSCRRKDCSERTKISKEQAEETFIELLQEIKPSEELNLLVKRIVGDVYTRKLEVAQDIQKNMKKELTELESKLERLEELLEDRIYSKDKFKEKSALIVAQIAAKRVDVSEANIEAYDLEEVVNFGMNMLQLLPDYWISLTTKAKHQLNEILFPKGLIVRDNRVTTLELSPLFKDIEDISNGDVPNGTRGRTRTDTSYKLNGF